MTHVTDVAMRPTKAIVDLDALAGNLQAFRRLVPSHVKLLAVVKANGYGHGAVMVARTALSAGVSQLAVATVAEGIQLRRAAVTAPILVLGPIGAAEVQTALHHDLTLTVGAPAIVDRIAMSARSRRPAVPANVHLKIDTGMHRFGCTIDEAPRLVTQIAGDDRLQLTGIFTHFARADESDEQPTICQAEQFDEVRAAIAAETSIGAPLFHAANSAATLRSRRYDYDMVRLGIAMYGIAPSTEVSLLTEMRPVMSLVSEVGRVVPLKAGDRVSYGGIYQSTAAEEAALVPIGYADGYRRSLSNRGWMGIGGSRAPIRGRVCMDQTVVGIPRSGTVRIGDEVHVVGCPVSGAPEWSDLAELIGTIPYELVTGIGARVPRVYLQGGRTVAIECLEGLSLLSMDN